MRKQSQGTSRRQLVAASASVLAAGVAGCTGDGGDGSDGEPTEQTTGTTAGTTEGTRETSDETTTAGYTVSMEPTGEVSFDSVPETWVANNGSWADMGIALGRDPPKGVWLTGRYRTQYYDAIPGVSVDKSDMVSLSSDGVSKELFYDLGGEVHVIDPNFLTNRFKGWSAADVEDVSRDLWPFFGNSIFSHGYPWHEDYPYYTLYEAFEKMADLFQERDRYEAFVDLHEEFQAAIADALPPASERPSVAILWPAAAEEPDSFYPYLVGGGTSFKQWRDLKVRDAFAETAIEDFHSSRGTVDYETLLQMNPDALMVRGREDMSAQQFEDTLVAYMRDHTVASNLDAVENGMVFRGGSLYQGPITNLVLTERAANQLYPDAFADVTLYDPQRVGDIVEGNA